MITIERPCCDEPLLVDVPLPDELRCDDCRVSWSVAEPEPSRAPDALAA